MIAGDWWDDDIHKLSVYATRVCECPYHTKLRDDDEADRREMAEEEDDED